MKTLFFLLLLIPILATGQNKYEKLFLQADSAFTAEYEKQKAKELDSIFELIDADSMKIETEVNKLLSIYICAYIDGYCNGNKPFNTTELKNNILNQRKAILFWIIFTNKDKEIKQLTK